MAYLLKSARYLAADCHRQVLEPGDRVIDATCGNGQDTCMLAQLVGDGGKVFAFDVQAAAIEKTKELLMRENLLRQCDLHHMGHEHVLNVVKEPVKLAVFNLGWLPGGDKSITTHWESTQMAIEGCLALLTPGGVCTICVYPGHAEGDRERMALEGWLAARPPQQFNILHQRFVNAGPGAPECYILQKQ